MTSASAAIKPPHEASDFENVPIRRSTRSSTPSSSRSRRPRPQYPHGVRLVDHQPCAEALAQLGDLAQGCDVALHREDAVDDDEDAAAVGSRLA